MVTGFKHDCPFNTLLTNADSQTIPSEATHKRSSEIGRLFHFDCLFVYARGSSLEKQKVQRAGRENGGKCCQEESSAKAAG